MKLSSISILCLSFFSLLALSPEPTYARELLVPVVQMPSDSSSPIEISFKSLPEVQLTPESPFFFLKILWEQGRLLAARFPQDKALLALNYARVRLSEALKVLLSEGNLAVIERLFNERARLLRMAFDLAKDDTEVRQELLEEVDLGELFLEHLSDSVPEDETPRVQNLVDWREDWLDDLGIDEASPSAFLGVPVSISEGTESAVLVNEATPAAGLEVTIPSEPGFFEKIFDFIFGSSFILSPLAMPGGD